MSSDPIQKISAADQAGYQFRYYDFVMAAFVTILLLSNIIGAAKLTFIEVPWWPDDFWPAADGVFIYGAGILFFPLGYVIGDILTEIYGFARARRVIWTGFASLIFLAIMSWVVVSLPPFDYWTCPPASNELVFGNQQSTGVPGAICQQNYEAVFGGAWRIVIASITAFWAGEFVNSYVMARMKIWTAGKKLWTRTIGSTVVGQGVDSLIFYPLAFWGIWETSAVITVMITNWVLKVLWEALLTPVTYAVVGWLKRKEGVDIYDENTNFTPFSTST